MKKIAVTGGKGGTGKSTFSALYSAKLAKEGKKVVLVDADVECPDDHLLFGAELKKEKEIMEPYPVLDREKCAKCGKCAKVCEENAIFHLKGKYPVFMMDLCSSCGACWTVCPQGAINTELKKTGTISTAELKENLWLVSGLSESTVTETGPIVRKTVEFAENFAREKGADTIIVDAAAGLHCPVIAAMIGCEKVFAVTEATPLGEHDISLALELVEKLGLPAEIIINKSDAGKKDFIYRVAKKKNIKIAKEIPYSKKLIEAYSRGKITEGAGMI